MTHGERFSWQCAVNDNCREKLFLAHVREHKAYGIFLCGKLSYDLCTVDIIHLAALFLDIAIKEILQ